MHVKNFTSFFCCVTRCQGHSGYDESRCQGFVCDLTTDSLSASIPGGVDLVSLFFVLSAITPEKMVDVLNNIFQVRNYV